MFAGLKKKIQEEGGTSLPQKPGSNANSAGVKVSTPQTRSEESGSRTNSVKKNGNETVLGSPPTADSLIRMTDDVLSDDVPGSREELAELLLKRTRQVKTLETRLSELTSLMKEKNQMIEKLETALEKQQDVMCQRVQEANEQLNTLRIKTAETVAGAVKKKEEEMKQVLKEMEKKNAQLEDKVADLEKYRNRVVEERDVRDDLDAFATQELTKVKHLLLKTQQELEQVKAEKCGDKSSNSLGDSETISRLEKQLTETNAKRSELEATNAELNELVTKLQAELLESKAALEKMASHSSTTQEDWLEKQIESEKCISDLEERVQSFKAEMVQRDTERNSIVKQLNEQLTELNATRSQLKAEQERSRTLQASVESHDAITTCLQQRCDQSESDCNELKTKLASNTAELETCRSELHSCRQEFDSTVQRNNDTVRELENQVAQLKSEHSTLLHRLDELEERRASDLASKEADVTARLRLEMGSLEDQIQDKNRVIKKQEQRLVDLKKLLQRELKVLPHGVDSTSTVVDVSTTSSRPLSAENGGSNGVLKVDIAAAAAAVGVHTSAVHHFSNDASEPASPATLNVTEVGAGRHRNGVTDGASASHWSSGRGDGATVGSRTRRLSHRSSAQPTSPSPGGAVMMSPVDSEYDFMRELNFKYLRHVVLKFMLSRESEALQLIKAVSMLLHFTPEEQKLIRDTLEWKKSWFGSRPQLPTKGQEAKIIPPSY